jgi:[ribosomal protein S5]-alanine N-acetyltransferase
MTETERLFIIPLTGEQLHKYILSDHSLEEELGQKHSIRTVSPELKEALEQTIIPGVADPDRNYLFSTLWTVICKAENIMVGDLCFVGEPNPAGEVEIGYGTYETARNKGYMTEAVGGVIRWAEKQPLVKSIVASTDKDNPASASVLVKNGFIRNGDAGTLIHWRLQIR